MRCDGQRERVLELPSQRFLKIVFPLIQFNTKIDEHVYNGTAKMAANNIVIRYKVYNEQHPRAGRNTHHVLYEKQARVGQSRRS